MTSNLQQVLPIGLNIIGTENQLTDNQEFKKTSKMQINIEKMLEFLLSTGLNPNDVNQFKSKLGFTRNHSPEVCDIITAAIEKEEPIFQKKTRWNDRYIKDLLYKNEVIKTAWAEENNELILIRCEVA